MGHGMNLALLEFDKVPTLYANGKLIFDGRDDTKKLISLQTIWRTNTAEVTRDEYIVKYYDEKLHQEFTLTGSTI